MTCPCEQRALREEAERLTRRKELELSLDWQFAVVSADRAARGERTLTRSEWLAGCWGDEENGDVAPASKAPLVVVGLYVIAVLLALGRMLT
jgi:hypothetical protein